MQVRAQQAAGLQRFQPFGVKLGRFERTETQTRPALPFRHKFTIQATQQSPEVETFGVVLAQIDARYHDFAVSGLQQAARFVHRLGGRTTARRPPCQGHDAIGTTVGTPVLYLENRARSPKTFNAERRKLSPGGASAPPRPTHGAARNFGLFLRSVPGDAVATSPPYESEAPRRPRPAEKNRLARPKPGAARDHNAGGRNCAPPFARRLPGRRPRLRPSPRRRR